MKNLRLYAIGLWIYLSTLSLLIAEVDPVSKDKPILLPPFIVSENASGTNISRWNWGYMAFPGYEILTCCGRDASNAFAGNVAAQLSILETISPAAFETLPSIPTSIILMDNSQARRITSDMRRAMTERQPRDNETDQRRFRYLPQLRLSDSESTAITVVIEPQNISGGVLLEPNYVKYLMDCRIPRLPKWYIHAMGELYRRAVFGDSAVSKDEEHYKTVFLTTSITFPPLVLERASAMLPLQDASSPAGGRYTFTRFFEDVAFEPEESTNSDATRWNNQGRLFLQWIFSDLTRSRITKLQRFLDDADETKTREAIFFKYFGLNFTQLQQTLNQFVPTACHDQIRFNSTTKGLDVDLTGATQAELARILGGWELKEVAFVERENSPFLDIYREQALSTFETAHSKGEADPDFLAEYGLYFIRENRKPEGRMLLEMATKSGSHNTAAYNALAEMLLQAALRGTNNHKLISGREASLILKLLESGSVFSPPQESTYIIYGITLANSDVPPTAANLAFLRNGLHFFPKNTDLILLLDGTLKK